MEESKAKLTKLFYEMLEYKNKKYKKDMKFEDLAELVSIHYNSFKYSFYELISAVKYREIYTPGIYDDDPFYDEEEYSLTDEEIAEILNQVYDELVDEEEGYKKHSNDYIDINLKEGQTLESLSKEYEDKLIDLFFEMLDFIGEKYQKDKYNSCYGIGVLVENEYPWYYKEIEKINHSHLYCVDANYIDLIDALDRLYNKLSKYKEEYYMYAEEYKDEIEAHKKWKEECKSIENINEEIKEKRKKDPLYDKLNKYKILVRKKRQERDIKEARKYMQMARKIKEELEKKYPYKIIDEDPYLKITYESDEDYIDFEEDEILD